MELPIISDFIKITSSKMEKRLEIIFFTLWSIEYSFLALIEMLIFQIYIFQLIFVTENDIFNVFISSLILFIEFRRVNWKNKLFCSFYWQVSQAIAGKRWNGIGFVFLYLVYKLWCGNTMRNTFALQLILYGYCILNT